MILKSKIFILRPYKKGDEKSLVENVNDKAVYRTTCNIPYPYTKKIAEEWIKKNSGAECKCQSGAGCGSRAIQKESHEINLAIDVGGNVVGGIGFKNRECIKAEIGYWLGKKYWGKGIATEALRLMTDFGFKKLKLRRIYAYVMTFNKASAKVLEKNGYEKEGKLRNHCTKDGKLIDVLLYARVR